MDHQSEVCICAAIQMLWDGYIVRGHRHNDCLRTAYGMPRYLLSERQLHEQGFVTSRGRFVGRREAAALQQAAGVVSKDLEHPYLNGECYSEDLY